MKKTTNFDAFAQFADAQLSKEEMKKIVGGGRGKVTGKQGTDREGVVLMDFQCANGKTVCQLEMGGVNYDKINIGDLWDIPECD